MFLKTEPFEYNSVTITLSELSALQRIEHLAWLKQQEEQLASGVNPRVALEDTIKTAALLVAMSLWHNHPQKAQMPSMDEAIKQLHQEVLTTWPVEAISAAADMVERLSGMSAPVTEDVPALAEDTAEPITAGKHSKAS